MRNWWDFELALHGTRCAFAGLFLAFVPMFGLGTAQAQQGDLNAPLEVVVFTASDTLRGVVGRTLGDPDLWPAVLDLNDIASPALVVPGTELRLPVRQVRIVDTALSEALLTIQQATAEGARIFAPRQIETAIGQREEAAAKRIEGQWQQVVDLASSATGLAKEALEISLDQRDRSAEAIVSDVHGSVQGRNPAEPIWSGRAVDDVLVEFERLRTLSDSTTQVTFRDLSRLRLNPNSNATIQRMRSDPITGGEVTKVSLVNGDFYALLNQLSDRSSFQIEVPGVESTTNSSDFWIKSDGDSARFVNFDDAALEIQSDGESIALNANEGAVLSEGAVQRTEVLDAPILRAPALGMTVYRQLVGLEWVAFDGAEGYWLEVALDAGFNQMRVSEWGIRDLVFEAGPLDPGTYHWRVAALDQLGLPGRWSTPQDFTVQSDATPPYLNLLAPASETVVSAPVIEVLGLSEADVALTLNDTPLTVEQDGSFRAGVTLKPGENTLSLRAIDPAGNVSERQGRVTYRPAQEVEIRLDLNLPRQGADLVTRSEVLTLTAMTTAEAGRDARVSDASGTVLSEVNVQDAGLLTFNVPVDAAAASFMVEVLAPDGAVEGQLRFSARRDAQPPTITLDQPAPRATDAAVLDLTGQIDEPATLLVDGMPAALREGAFALELELDEGVNSFELSATDAAGNVSVLRVSTRLDLTPPELGAVRLARPDGAGGAIEIAVEAQDQSGLRQAASYVISVGGTERTGYLKCDAQAGLCRATLPAELGDLRLVELAVEDYAGNIAFR
ncbi:FecR domain-containing protein [Aestuariivita sp.]|jgi:hypothetical protein|uniref:FecR domain-containing protein n=1 Tax=Aestuariivita sp. TaxID=1872407 RepID=UPI0021749FF6|nr:FecR domain-containing protein [Aestuariivita sp.]MCE8008378.1 FecR domain-containing protein [Aestuariivita sp.]